MPNVNLYIVKDQNVGCIYGEKCLRSGACSDIIELLTKQLRTHFLLEFCSSTNTAIIDISDLLNKPYHFDSWGVDGKGNNFNIYQFSRKFADGVRCNTNLNVNHPSAEQIREAILEATKPLSEKGYKIQ